MLFLPNFVAHEFYRHDQEGDREKVNGTTGGENGRDPEVRSTIDSPAVSRRGSQTKDLGCVHTTA